MNFIDKIRDRINKDSKKLLTNLFIILLLGISILIVLSTFSNNENNNNIIPNLKQDDNIKQNEFVIDDYASQIEIKLESILSQIKGVGKVDVMITLEDSSERIPAFNTTETEEKTDEKDSQGGSRSTIKKDLIHQAVISNSSNDNPLLVIKEIKPKVRGVIVVAEGADDSHVKEKLYTAVKTVLGIPGNKVEIFSSN